MKRITSLILLVIMLLSLSVTVSAQEEVNLYVDKKYVQNANGFIENGRTMVPVRALAEKMQSEVIWVESERKVILNKPCDKMEYNGTTYENVVARCELILGKAEIKIKLLKDDKEIFNVLKKIDCIANAINGRTHIPARFVGYALGYSVEYRKELSGHKVYYEFIGKQTIDFDIQEDKDNTPKLDYDYDKEKYPDITTVYDKDYPSRKGYEDIVIIDTSIGKYENGKMVNLVPYKFIQNNYIIESDEKEYDLSNNKTPEENLETFKKFYEDKVHDKVKVEKYDNGGIGLNPTYSTINDAIYLKYAPYQVLYELYYDQEAINYIGNKKYYGIDVYFTKYDFSKYFMHNTISNDLQYGSKLTNGFGIDAGVHNSLLMSNEFLGEIGQRIWKMMNDYYTLEGAFYVNPNTEWTKCHPETTLMLADPLDPISDKQASEYGLNIIKRFKSPKTTTETLVINSGKQNIYVHYRVPDISSSVPTYCIFFEYIE